MAHTTPMDIAYDVLVGGDRVWRIQHVVQYCRENRAYCGRVFAYLHGNNVLPSACRNAARFTQSMQGKTATRYATTFVDMYDTARKTNMTTALNAIDKVAQKLPSLDSLATNLDAAATGLCKAIEADDPKAAERAIQQSLRGMSGFSKSAATAARKMAPHLRTVARDLRNHEPLWPYALPDEAI